MYIALIGLILGVIDVELHLAMEKSAEVLKNTRENFLVGYFVYIFTGPCYNAHDISRLSYNCISLYRDSSNFLIFSSKLQIMSVDTGHSAIQCGITKFRRIQICAELFVCSICPLPGKIFYKHSRTFLGDTEITWPLLGSDISSNKSSKIPLYVLLTVPMFFRLYLLGRYVVLHSYMIRVIYRNFQHYPSY